MGRPCEFDRNRAVEIAAQLFREKGYESTSIEDLTTALNISRASLYNAFGDKHGLLIETMQSATSPTCALDHPGVVPEVIADFLRSIAREKLGCFYLTLGVELASTDPEVRRRVRKSLETSRLKFRELIVSGQQRGEVPGTVDPDAASRVLLGAMVSILTLARVHPDRHVTNSVIEHALRILHPILD